MSRRPRVDEDLRQLILATYDAGASYKETAERLDVAFATVGRIVTRYGTPRTKDEGLALFNQRALTEEGRRQRSEAGARGGTACRDRHDAEFYQRIGRKGGLANLAAHGSEHFAAMGKRGGSATSARHGLDFYREIGNRGGARVREMCAKARAMEEQG